MCRPTIYVSVINFISSFFLSFFSRFSVSSLFAKQRISAVKVAFLCFKPVNRCKIESVDTQNTQLHNMSHFVNIEFEISWKI